MNDKVKQLVHNRISTITGLLPNWVLKSRGVPRSNALAMERQALEHELIWGVPTIGPAIRKLLADIGHDEEGEPLQ